MQGPVSTKGQVRNWGIRRSSASPRPPCAGTPSASVWPSPRQTPGPPCPYPSDRTPPYAANVVESAIIWCIRPPRSISTRFSHPLLVRVGYIGYVVSVRSTWLGNVAPISDGINSPARTLVKLYGVCVRTKVITRRPIENRIELFSCRSPNATASRISRARERARVFSSIAIVHVKSRMSSFSHVDNAAHIVMLADAITNPRRF